MGEHFKNEMGRGRDHPRVLKKVPAPDAVRRGASRRPRTGGPYNAPTACDDSPLGRAVN
jgi:hypothetical protein